MNMQKINKLTLQNGEAFVARGAVTYVDKHGIKDISGNAGDITLGQTMGLDPDKRGVSDRSIVSLYVAVVAGANNEATQSFIFQNGSSVAANYTINGLARNNSLGVFSAERFP